MTMNFPTITRNARAPRFSRTAHEMLATGQNIVRLRKAAGLSVKDLMDVLMRSA